jgi:bacteriocin biosynthesis cyclodehydratase domain-containing protein
LQHDLLLRQSVQALVTSPRSEPAAPAQVVPERPLLAPWTRAAVEPHRVILQLHDRAIVLEGAAAERLLPSLLPLLDGERSAAELEECFGAAIAPAVRNAIETLAASGLLVAGPSASSSPPPAARQAELGAAFGLAAGIPSAALAALARRRIGVVGSGACAVLIAALVAAGGAVAERLGVEEAVADAALDLVIAAPGAGERSCLQALNAALLDEARPWLAVPGCDGARVIVGPIVVPGASCCYECYRRRRAAASEFGDAWEGLDRSEPPALPPAATMLAAALAAQIALCALVEGVGVAVPAGVVWAIELVPEVAVSRHVVHRAPRCPVCSAATALPPLLPWRAEGA